MFNNVRILLYITIILVAAAFQGWFMGLDRSNLVHQESQGGLVDSYTDALSRGKPYLLTAQALESGALSENDARLRILDASYFKGHYYIYYGIGPFALVLVPWRTITGTFLSSSLVVLILSVAGYFAYGGALLILFRNDGRPHLSWLLLVGIITIIIGSGTWVLMDQPGIHQVEAAAAYATMGAAIFCLVTVATCEMQPLVLLCGATIFAGLTMASRPNCLPAVLVIAVTAGYFSWNKPLPFGVKIKRLLLVGAPLVAVAIALAGWNYVRFASILEFGMNYGTGAVGRINIVKYSFSNIPYNLYHYLVGGFRVESYFPFIGGMKEGAVALPTDTHEGMDQVYGCLLFFPALLFGGFALWKSCRMGTLLLAAGAGNLLLLAGFGFGTFRYAVDYLGIIAFLGAVGICFSWDFPLRYGRWIIMSALGVFILWSWLGGLLLAASVAREHGSFDINRPKDFAKLGYFFNQAAYRLEAITQGGPRAIRVKFSLPMDKYGHVEPLLVYGNAGLQDFIYFYYTAPQQIQVGFESIGHGGPLSLPIAIDYAQPHVADIILGNAVPPDGHPLLHSISAGDLLIARQRISIVIDGQTVLEESGYLHPSRSRFLLGESPDDPAFGSKFTGRLTEMKGRLLRNIGLLPRWSRNDFGPIEVQLSLNPSDKVNNQPLISVGNRPFGAMLTLDYVSQTKIRLNWIESNGRTISSNAINCADGDTHTLEFSVGSLLPTLQSSLWGPAVAPKEKEETKQRLSCVLDGKEVWLLRVNSPDTYPSTIRVGENSIQLSNVPIKFNGEILSFKRKIW